MIYVDSLFFEHPHIWEARDVPYVAVHPNTRFDFFSSDQDVVVSETPAGVSSVTEVTPQLLDSWKKKETDDKAQARADHRVEIEEQRVKDGGIPRLDLDDLKTNSSVPEKTKEKKEAYFSQPTTPLEMGDVGKPVDTDPLGDWPITPDLSEPNQSLDG